MLRWKRAHLDGRGEGRKLRAVVLRDERHRPRRRADPRARRDLDEDVARAPLDDGGRRDVHERDVHDVDGTSTARLLRPDKRTG